jgi:hypothetical protein
MAPLKGNRFIHICLERQKAEGRKQKAKGKSKEESLSLFAVSNSSWRVLHHCD